MITNKLNMFILGAKMQKLEQNEKVKIRDIEESILTQ